VTGIPPAPRGVPQIEVTFDIDANGLLSVKAKELGTGVEQSVTIQGASNLEQKEIEKMLADAEKYASFDQEKRKNIDIKNQAETLCYEAEKELDLLKDKISSEEKNNIIKLIEDIRQNIKIDNFDSLQPIIDDLKLSMKNIMDKNQVTDSMGGLNDL